MRTWFLFLLLLNGTLLYGQKEGYIWYFGEGTGLSFHTSPPKVLTQSSLRTYEGCSAISDKDGNLILYTDGVNIWNKDHNLVENGDSLHGNASSTQSGLILANPYKRNIYYVFTVDASENKQKYGLEYAVVDISLNDGSGKVVEKYNSLLAPGTEKVTGIIHKNGRDVWILTHGWNTDKFYAFLVSDSGVSQKPIVSSIGSMHVGHADNSIGYLKASPSGKKVAAAIYESSLVEIFDFNTESGTLSNYERIRIQNGKPYGLEFSSDNQYLYVSTHFDGGIYQYDLSAEAIFLSRKTIHSPDGKNMGALQLGPDGNIYVQQFQKDFLGIIKKNNKAIRHTDYSEEGLYLGSTMGRYGLPTFVQSYFDTEYINQIQSYYLSLKLKYSGEELKVDTLIIILNGDTNTFTRKVPEIKFKSKDLMKVYVKKSGYFSRSVVMDSSMLSSLTEKGNILSLDIEMQKVEKEREIILENIYYNYNSAELRTDTGPALDKLLKLLRDNPKINIQINSHTDCRGSESYNNILSLERAKSVVDYLIQKGVSAKRLVPKGFGESRLKIDCICNKCRENEHQINRRTSFQVL